MTAMSATTWLLADAYIHRLDPFAIQFPAGWPIAGIRWYGLAYLAGFAITWWLIRWMARTGRSPMKPASVADLMVYVVVGVLVGGRLGYCLFYDQSLLVELTSVFPWWGVLAIHKGGMASHGGVLGVIAACWIYARRHDLSVLHLVDMGGFVCLPGLFLGRLANFVNGELPGEKLPAAMQADPPWWSVKYPEDLVLSQYDPGALAEVRPELAEALHLEPTVRDSKLLLDAREAVLEGNEQVTELIEPALSAYYPSQLIQALTDGPLLIALIAIVWWAPRKPGVVGSWFLIGYGVLRIASEVFRQPDAGVGTWATPFGELSRGQALSILMVLAGIVGLILCARRDVEKLGGLRPRPRGGTPTAPPGSPEPASG